jgi:ribosomal protein S18 acetylase RimI-like enzyme
MIPDSFKQKEIREITIEPVRTADLVELADLASRTFADAFGASMDPEDLEQSLAENRSVAYFDNAIKESRILVAKYNGKIVGYVQYGPVKMKEAGAAKNDRELGRLYVETELQGKGIGRRLMDAALDDPEMKRAPRVFLQVWEENQKALAMYEGYGFRQCGVTTFEIAGKPAQDLIMVRDQTPIAANSRS